MALPTPLQTLGAPGSHYSPGLRSVLRLRRIADGPDEVHMSQLTKLTMRRASSELPNG